MLNYLAISILLTVATNLAMTSVARSESVSGHEIKTYIIDPARPDTPSEVSKHKGPSVTATSNTVLMRDPIGLHDVDPVPSKTVVKVPVKAPALKATQPAKTIVAHKVAGTWRETKVGKVSFSSLSVAGQVQEPRVDFKKERLDVQRIDEFPKMDMYDRIKQDPTTQSLSH